MEIPANYIRRIEIHGLWHRYDIAWDLRPDVNILSGINGVGKTTILNRSVGYLEQTSGAMKTDEKNGVRVFFDNPEATYIPYDVIRSYDRPLIMGDFTARMADPNVRSELDWQLYLLQRRYLDYQVNVGNKMIELLSSDDEQLRNQASSCQYPNVSFRIWWTTFSVTPIRKSTGRATKSCSIRTANGCCPTSCLPAKSRCLSFC